MASLRARTRRHINARVALVASPIVIRAIVIVALALPARSLTAQLRPLEPIPWRSLTDAGTVAGQIGASLLREQRASLAGTSGNLWEVANFALTWRTGRVVLEAAGTGQRFFQERERFSEPHPEVRMTSGDRRHDAGDLRISTIVRLTPDRWPFDGALRFGTRLPTTDNAAGLDRDALDFFTTAGAAVSRRAFGIAAEAGLGIHSTREVRFEQEDLFLYALRLEYRGLALTPSATILGQMHGTGHSEIRGVEDLGELRVGVTAGDRKWFRVELIKGYEAFSPKSGVTFTAGFRR